MDSARHVHYAGVGACADCCGMTDLDQNALDAAIVVLLNQDDADLDQKQVAKNNTWTVAHVRAGAVHDGDCTKQAHTCLLCLVTEYEAKASATIIRRAGDACSATICGG